MTFNVSRMHQKLLFHMLYAFYYHGYCYPMIWRQFSYKDLKYFTKIFYMLKNIDIFHKEYYNILQKTSINRLDKLIAINLYFQFLSHNIFLYILLLGSYSYSTSLTMVQIRLVLPFPGSQPDCGSPNNSYPISVPKILISCE